MTIRVCKACFGLYLCVFYPIWVLGRGGGVNKGDGLASQPRRYRVPGQPLLNWHQVGGVSRSSDVCAIGAGAHQGQTSREGEKDIWWMAGTGNRAPGPRAHRNTARQAMDGLWTEVRGQQKQSNDPGNNQHILNTPIIGHR